MRKGRGTNERRRRPAKTQLAGGDYWALRHGVAITERLCISVMTKTHARSGHGRNGKQASL